MTPAGPVLTISHRQGCGLRGEPSLLLPGTKRPAGVPLPGVVGVGDCRGGAGWVRERLPQAARAVSGRLPDFHTRYSGGEGGLSVGVRNRERPDRGGGGIARYVARSHAKQRDWWPWPEAHGAGCRNRAAGGQEAGHSRAAQSGRAGPSVPLEQPWGRQDRSGGNSRRPRVAADSCVWLGEARRPRRDRAAQGRAVWVPQEIRDRPTE